MNSSHQLELDCGYLNRSSCKLTPAEFGEYDGIAGLRMILASLSVVGTLSIIILAIGKRQAFKSKIHPMFVLSLADFVLACLWIIGGYFWLAKVDNRALCLVVSLVTIIVQCITINLTLIYAILAYHALKKAKSGSTNTLIMRATDNLALEKAWKFSLTVGVYAIAWIAPAVIMMLVFAIVAGTGSEIVTKVNSCSCWCLPTYGNVLPYAFAQDNATANYAYAVSRLLAAYGSVVSCHYLIVFVLLVIIYHKILNYIKQIRLDNYYEKSHSRTYNYGGISRSIIDSQSNARTRVSLYVLVFLINGLINFLLSLGFVFYEGLRLPHGLKYVPEDRVLRPGRVTFIVVITMQSLTVPLQGFLNAIIYGWTRNDFINSMALLAQPEDKTMDHTDGLGQDDRPKGHKQTNSSLLYGRKTSSLDNHDLLQGQDILTDTET